MIISNKGGMGIQELTLQFPDLDFGESLECDLALDENLLDKMVDACSNIS